MKIYIDTSVYSTCKCPKRGKDTTKFFGWITANKRVSIVVSPVLEKELLRAQQEQRNVLGSIATEQIISCDQIITEETMVLSQEYIRHGALTQKSVDDALHIAYATITECDILLTWNMRHMAKLRRKEMYNKINKTLGYKEIKIITPEQMDYEK